MSGAKGVKSSRSWGLRNREPREAEASEVDGSTVRGQGSRELQKLKAPELGKSRTRESRVQGVKHLRTIKEIPLNSRHI